MNDALMERVRRRLKARRERIGMSQDELARHMALKHRQTLGAIETGARRIRPEELALAARVLEVAPDYFTDRYSAAGEASFSFRTAAVDEEELTAFEEQAGRWIATYRELGGEVGQAESLLTAALSLSEGSSYEAARAAAGDVRRRLGLGRFPARDLQAALEREWGILVLHVDPPAGISGAASRLDGLQVILVNRGEPLGRRNYDLAHELFHLLTWDRMPPERLDPEPSGGGEKGTARRVEKLAENFAAALLMPEESVRELWDARESEVAVAQWIALVADDFGVSGSALKWRLYNLKLLRKGELPDDAEIREGHTGEERYRPTPMPFSQAFVHRAHAAVEAGTLSLRKASRLLGVDTSSFARLCESYDRPLSYEV